MVTIQFIMGFIVFIMGFIMGFYLLEIVTGHMATKKVLATLKVDGSQQEM